MGMTHGELEQMATRMAAAEGVDDGFYLCENMGGGWTPCEVEAMRLWPLYRADAARSMALPYSLSLVNDYKGALVGPLLKPGAHRVPDPAPKWPRAPAGTRCTKCGKLCDEPEEAFQHLGDEGLLDGGWQHYQCSGLGGYMAAERAAGNTASSPVEVPQTVGLAHEVSAALDQATARERDDPCRVNDDGSVTRPLYHGLTRAHETKHYSDGSSATGPGPLPELSPEQQDARDHAAISFHECPTCAAKPGTPELCASCQHNRLAIDRARSILMGDDPATKAAIARDAKWYAEHRHYGLAHEVDLAIDEEITG